MSGEEDFFEPPKRMFWEYLKHLALIFLDILFMLAWVGFQAIYHWASELIIEKIGLGPIDRVVKTVFDLAFAGMTFFWVVRTIWKVHSDAYAQFKKKRVRNTSRGEGREKPDQ